jgi:hypothetical protein
MDDAAPPQQPWPHLPLEEWSDTRDTLHLWTQVVGKVLLANTPLVNHWWNTTLHVSARGLATPLIPHASGQDFDMVFDFVDDQLVIARSDGAIRAVTLKPRSVADFYASVMNSLDELDLHTEIWPMPVEIENAIPFDQDEEHQTYDPDHARAFWQLLRNTDRVFSAFRSRFVGKVSPVHFFWGAADLAVTRFSGRTAPPHPGGAPNCGPHVMIEAYSHEVSSAGFWPGGDGEGLFYSYAYPEPDGFRAAPVSPAVAHFDEELGEFVLPYEAVRTSSDPDGMLLEFLQSTYEAAADGARWDRIALERPAGPHPR